MEVTFIFIILINADISIIGILVILVIVGIMMIDMVVLLGLNLPVLADFTLSLRMEGLLEDGI
jgi:hypothetical protein